MKALIARFVSIALVTIIAAACGGGDRAGTAGSTPELAEYRIAKCSHAVGLCNLPLFISKENSTTLDFGVQLTLTNIPNWADHPAALSSGRIDFSVTPFTNVLTGFAHGAPIKIVAGSGINGLYILGTRDVKELVSLRGKRIGTFQADTLEMLLYAALRQSKISYDEVEIVYFTDAFELMNAFGSGRVDAMTHVEPYASRAVSEYAANRLASGQEVWGGDHPDCVLTASQSIIDKDPEMVKAVILGMLRAQLFIEQNLETAVKSAVGKYYKAELNDILRAAESQPPGVDIRDKQPFISARFEDLRTLRYVDEDATFEGLVDFSLLEEVISENQDLHQRLRFRARGE